MLSSLREYALSAIVTDFKSCFFCNDCGVPFLASTLDQGASLILHRDLKKQEIPTEVNLGDPRTKFKSHLEFLLIKRPRDKKLLYYSTLHMALI